MFCVGSGGAGDSCLGRGSGIGGVVLLEHKREKRRKGQGKKDSGWGRGGDSRPQTKQRRKEEYV